MPTNQQLQQLQQIQQLQQLQPTQTTQQPQLIPTGNNAFATIPQISSPVRNGIVTTV